MNSLLRLIVVAAVIACAILAVVIGLARNTDAMAAPSHVLMLLVGLALYLVPSGLALHRNCAAIGWIIALNILLGWTLFGWIAALGWAISGKPAGVPRGPGVRPIPGH